ncbi:ribulose 1,5-bisphosphate carboxylase large subunit [Rhodococcus sp. BP-252]|uniref:Ribulose 1,5-bisphosphate carboxylase large subunit n=1 Tax=Rhodococcoides kyotonense TaxID=398843 RepID=A0A177Y6X0_9NOCA|nr:MULTISPECIES: ribulose 1,5-bisphosphate carboxylase large subunit [Rhodococcus]MBY6413826.1 ribulose 1,5-bisphosphate carboxylase large subunit [Rhodococcus sp. BP-320]MBY6419246.1 ribulose 1,5-bisphosphate carboxylase large subunit [Rhodococcus sp. BP-321]MBY6424103.1 ribulose 1,5-bisphosphate carboxylase large subunit [Rhodococcus sp. BP-324]MBY6428601.1 ribulose 1,5-bisphosphate carboxylase large subunit [Rhodococcus sp. BP-323]MBY6434353.1 ribulose 1,5-bisphosphate carboxylase large sub
MALVLAGVRLPDPVDGKSAVGFGIGVVKASARWARESVTFAVELPGRISALLDEAAVLVARIDAVVDAAQRLIDRTGGVIDRVDSVVDGAASTTRAANDVVLTAGATSTTALELVELFDPIAQQSAPFAKKFVDHLSEDEVDAAIEMVDQLPGLVKHMEAVIPILATLDTVSPEIHELLAVTKDVRRAVIGIPGFKFFRNRGEEKLADEEDHH